MNTTAERSYLDCRSASWPAVNTRLQKLHLSASPLYLVLYLTLLIISRSGSISPRVLFLKSWQPSVLAGLHRKAQLLSSSNQESVGFSPSLSRSLWYIIVIHTEYGSYWWIKFCQFWWDSMKRIIFGQVSCNTQHCDLLYRIRLIRTLTGILLVEG